MSMNSLAAFRNAQRADLQKLAEDHFQHDLQQSDRDALKSAAGTLSMHATIGSIVGLGVGLAFAWRIRSTRQKIFQAFRTAEKPAFVKFADGREQAIPDITPLVAPTTLGDFAAFTFFSIAGLFVGGETGVMTGAYSAKKSITNDPEMKRRVEKAFQAFRVDVLKKEIAALESGKEPEMF